MSKRTQLYFPDPLFDDLKRRAKKQRSSIAEIVRSAVKDYLSKDQARDWDQDPVWRMIGQGESREGDLSIHHDQYLYGRH
jgi:metal-responsive CopG/Arc/MetJ family transcriptional regulator